MTTVYLYGHLGRTFGHRWALDVRSPAEAVRAITANRPDFHRYMIEHSAPGYHVLVGPDPIADARGLRYPSGQQAIKIVPVIVGAQKSPIISIIAGVVIMVAAVVSFQYEFLPAAYAVAVGGIGLSLTIGGITQLLASTPNAPGIEERPGNKPSFFFNGPVNTTAQGHPVPAGYGRLRIGGSVVSASIVTEDILL